MDGGANGFQTELNVRGSWLASRPRGLSSPSYAFLAFAPAFVEFNSIQPSCAIEEQVQVNTLLLNLSPNTNLQFADAFPHWSTVE